MIGHLRSKWVMINDSFRWLRMSWDIYNFFLFYLNKLLSLYTSLRCFIILKLLLDNPNLLEFRISSLVLEYLFALKLRLLLNYFVDWICLVLHVGFSSLYRLSYFCTELRIRLFILKLLVHLHANSISVPWVLCDFPINVFMTCTKLPYLSRVLRSWGSKVF